MSDTTANSFHLCIPSTTTLEEFSSSLLLAYRLDKKVFQHCNQLSDLLENLGTSYLFHKTHSNCFSCHWMVKFHYSTFNQLQDVTLEKDNLTIIIESDLCWSCFYSRRKVPQQASLSIAPSRIYSVVDLFHLMFHISNCVLCIGCNPSIYPSSWFYQQENKPICLTSQDGRGTTLGMVDSSHVSQQCFSLYAVDCHVLLVNKLGVLRCPACRKLKITLYRRLQRQEKENQNPNLSQNGGT
ncbi:hypothetical protein Gasu2_38590 [Galdieria sulphuraria]|uniref:Uncharacterized protein n=1 Tax=Galdieria sulphuraria TaxID=130081 RepID=M2W8I4_GALSU|nr:uncharacterized protein Gasu_06040 [Galdieria sulphuraria]EME32191.1 hypothetical protein Gasu_06040 [Galdieria sulphuraria]GJD09615.1 hypothetical protein Gasu2_38590 [Galdieria sulphuraria]|eukprot:XP_005708711.1 hypothetical protein Gasu_06040 [Galdieria sulphuraria]